MCWSMKLKYFPNWAVDPPNLGWREDIGHWSLVCCVSPIGAVMSHALENHRALVALTMAHGLGWGLEVRRT